MLLYSEPIFLQHETGAHIENAGRLRLIPERLAQTGLEAQVRRPSWAPVSMSRLRLVHSPSYIDQVWAFAKSGGGYIEADTVVSPSSYDVALMAAGAVCDAVERILRGEDRQALCLVRPPGHHALTSGAMGFCIFNNVAVGARVAEMELGLERILIVDWDIHHGNGTQATFWEDGHVGFFSIHRWPFYPGTGWEDERGAGPGLGTTLNVPIFFGTPRTTYIEKFRSALEKFADRIRPELIFISAGFDTHRQDPLGGLGLETEDFQTLTEIVLDIAQVHAQGRVISVLEGGYDPEILTDCIELHLRTLLDRNPTAASTDGTKSPTD